MAVVTPKNREDLIQRKLQIECDRAEWDFARVRNEYIETKEVFDYIKETFTQIAARLRDLPKRAAPLLADKKIAAPEIEVLLREEVEDVMRAIALDSEEDLIGKTNESTTTRISEESEGDAEEVVPTKTELECKRVGRPKSNTPKNRSRKGKVANGPNTLRS